MIKIGKIRFEIFEKMSVGGLTFLVECIIYMREILKRIGALLKIIAPLSDPPSEKVHMLINWSPPGIEPGSIMAWNAIALTARLHIYIDEKKGKKIDFRQLQMKAVVNIV